MSLNFAKQNSLPPFLPPSNGKGVFFGQEKKVRKKWQKIGGDLGVEKGRSKKGKEGNNFQLCERKGECAAVQVCVWECECVRVCFWVDCA